jgi:hypothetical protein
VASICGNQLISAPFAKAFVCAMTISFVVHADKATNKKSMG